MKVKITNKKDKTDAYSLNLSKAFGVRRMGDALIVYYGGSDAMFSFPSKQYKFEEVDTSFQRLAEQGFPLRRIYERRQA